MKYFLIETEKKDHISFGNSKRNLRIAGENHGMEEMGGLDLDGILVGVKEQVKIKKQ